MFLVALRFSFFDAFHPNITPVSTCKEVFQGVLATKIAKNVATIVLHNTDSRQNLQEKATTCG